MGEPHSAQNLPVLVFPQEQVHSVGALGAVGVPSLEAPQFAQNLPVFCAPQEQVQGSGFLLPHEEQNAPVFMVPQEQFQELA